jgi:hypothetical protein
LALNIEKTYISDYTISEFKNSLEVVDKNYTISNKILEKDLSNNPKVNFEINYS